MPASWARATRRGWASSASGMSSACREAMMARSRSGSSVLSARWMVATAKGWAGSMPPGSLSAVPRTESATRRHTSVITSPVTRVRSARPSAARWVRATSVGASSRSAAWSVSTRLCSSGMRRLNERSPASRWATRRCILTADRVPASVMVGNGIDTETFTVDGPVADDGAAGPYFVYAGTVSEWQGAGVFIDAFAQVRAEHPRARLLFFSEGSGRDELEARVREQGIEGIEFRDKIPPSQVAAQLRGAVAGLSSITPGQGYEFALPTKIYAATATGTPVIHAGEGAARDRIRDNGLGWACDYDAEQVAGAMSDALSGEEAPAPEHLRRWTLQHASLAACAGRAAEQVLASLRR